MISKNHKEIPTCFRLTEYLIESVSAPTHMPIAGIACLLNLFERNVVLTLDLVEDVVVDLECIDSRHLAGSTLGVLSYTISIQEVERVTMPHICVIANLALPTFRLGRLH